MTNTAATVVPFRDASGSGALLFDADVLPEATPALFDSGDPALAAQPVAAGGRGAAWFVHTAAGAAVLRHYLRGGAVRFIHDLYLYSSAERTRAFREFRLLQTLRERGLPVPRPLAAAFWRVRVGYRAALLIARIADARSFGELLRAGEAPDWAAIGRTIARFHRAGVCHADLNVDNVLMDAHGSHWLIDFDKSRLRAPTRAWQQKNFARLLRSLRKQIGARADSVEIVEGWKMLQSAYENAMREPA